MERQIGEKVVLEVVEHKGDCRQCVFYNEENCSLYKDLVGECDARKRSDCKSVIFVPLTAK